MKRNDKFSSLYKISIRLYSKKHNISINIPKSDIVSISIINNYDTMKFPIMRFRIYSDITIIQSITECPNDFYICGNFDGGIYRMNDEKTPDIVSPIKNQQFQLKIYIENKNIPTSKMDNYIDGEKKDSSLNSNIKVPIEIFGYNETLIHLMKQKTTSIYKNISLLSVIEDIFNRNGIMSYQIDPIYNQEKYNQILIPNLNISQTLSFFESRYGLYKKGGQIFGDIDKVYVCDTDVNNNTKPLPIYVDSYRNTNDMSGMRKNNNNNYFMETMAKAVSIISETDIERTLNAPDVTSINTNDLTVKSNFMQNLYAEEDMDIDKMRISIPNILHKTLNQYVNDMYIARTDEKITKVDVSGVGFDVWKLKVNTRYNLVFESAIRGVKMNQYYRARYICHTFTNINGDLFIAQTTMNLCSN